MGLRFPQQIHGNCFFITSTYRDWLALGDILGFNDAVLKSLSYCLNKYSALTIGYVLMPSHIHLIIVVDGKRLASLMRDFKKFVAQKVAPDFGIEEKNIWMPRYDRIALTSDKVLRTKLNYIHNNPVRKGLVNYPEDWKWSSAKDYYTEYTGNIEIWKEWSA